jgi:hypothetical protein
LVTFCSLSLERVAAGSSSLQLVLDFIYGKFKPSWTPVDDNSDMRPVAFAETRDDKSFT